jgi:UDP-2-acetamido-2-deoxy-ribo-hexuluronate aminotransferase
VKLDIFEDELEKRDAAAAAYSRALADCGVEALPVVRGHRRSAWAQYTVRVAHRDRVAEGLKEHGIPTAVHYPLTLAAQPALAEFDAAALPRSEHAARTVLSLPLHPYLTTTDIARVASALEAVLASDRVPGPPE